MFKINDTLRQDILKDIPEDYSKLKTALTIYARLCQKLDYSMDYLINIKEKIFREANYKLVEHLLNGYINRKLSVVR